MINIIGDASKANIGGKAFTLKQLANKGNNVPPFFVVSASVMQDYLTSEIRSLIEIVNPSDPKNLKEQSQKISKAISQIDLEFMHVDSINKYSDMLPSKKYAVRSSASVEDERGTSFAGQFTSVLGVTKNNLQEAIKKCWKSLFNPTVLTYCHEKGISLEELQMGVIVQEMIEADRTGIVFSANPQGILNELVITATNQELGTHQDNMPTTTYYFNRTDNIYNFEAQETSPKLSKQELRKLIDISKQLTENYQKYLDIEYAVKNDEIYVLQSRPITTINLEDPIVLDNSNIVESYPGIILPLTISFVKESYHGIFRGVLRRGLGDKVADNFEDITSHMVESVNGRIYYQLTGWLVLIHLMPFSNRVLPVWKEMLGIKQGANAIRLRIGPYYRTKSFIRTIYMSFALPSKMRKLEMEFDETRVYFNQKFKESMSSQNALKLFREIKKRTLRSWDLTLSNDTYAFVHTGLLKKIIGPEFDVGQFISGIKDLTSLEPVKEFAKLTEKANSDQILSELEKIKNDKDANKYLANGSAFSDACWEFIDEYGDRGLAELKLENKTFRSSPSLLFEAIRKQAKEDGGLMDVGRSEALENHIISSLKRPLVGFVKKRALTGIKNREISRLNRSRIFGMVRSLFLVVAKDLERNNVIENSEDIFYLRLEEVEKAVEGKFNAIKIILKRKQQYEGFAKLPGYSRLIFANRIFDKPALKQKAEALTSQDNVLQGTPCSAGSVTATAVVVEDPSLALDTKDRILVTKMTDPGWVYLMVSAKGIIAEKGSLLSHTAIVAREIGIPAIVGVKQATEMIKTGDKIKMDANTGGIEVLR